MEVQLCVFCTSLLGGGRSGLWASLSGCCIHGNPSAIRLGWATELVWMWWWREKPVLLRQGIPLPVDWLLWWLSLFWPTHAKYVTWSNYGPEIDSYRGWSVIVPATEWSISSPSIRSRIFGSGVLKGREVIEVQRPLAVHTGTIYVGHSRKVIKYQYILNAFEPFIVIYLCNKKITHFYIHE